MLKHKNNSKKQQTMATFIQTSGGFLRTLKVTYWSLFAGQFIFATVTFIINFHYPVEYGEFHPNDIFSYIVPMLVLSGSVGGHFISKSAIDKAKNKPSFKQKLESYKSALVIRYAMLEGPNLFCLVAYLLTSNLIFMYIAVAVMVYYLMSYPKTSNLMNELDLSSAEIDQLNDSQFQLH